MRARRVMDRNNVIFNYKDLLDKRQQRGKKLIKMKHGPRTFTSEEGTRFFIDHPFKWVSKEEASFLLSLPEKGYVFFVPSTIEEVEDYYAIE